MTDDINIFSIPDITTPNCNIKISGDHFFADRKLYTNVYGIAFFSSPEDYTDNPYLSPAYERSASILEEYFGDKLPIASASSRLFQRSEIAEKVTKTVDRRFLANPPTKEKAKGPVHIECSYMGIIGFEGFDTLVLTYGSTAPATLCITDDSLSAILPFSPFSVLSCVRDKRTVQSVNYPIRTSPFLPPQDLSIDFAVNTKKFEYTLNNNFSGSLLLEYTLEVGTAKCEASKLRIEFSPLADRRESKCVEKNDD